MECPVCADVNLVMSERQGIEIDYCPQCRGVWLDRGELDKIVERSASQPAQRAHGGQSQGPPPLVTAATMESSTERSLSWKNCSTDLRHYLLRPMWVGSSSSVTFPQITATAHNPRDAKLDM